TPGTSILGFNEEKPQCKPRILKTSISPLEICSHTFLPGECASIRGGVEAPRRRGVENAALTILY
ncbi:MAG: hypothetical protein ACFE9D_12715, partial [Promethearchaeota archaeon]